MSQTSKEAAQARAESSFRRKERQADGKVAMAEYEAALVATREKTARLRKLREAKEAEDAARPAAAPEPARAKKSPRKASAI